MNIYDYAWLLFPVVILVFIAGSAVKVVNEYERGVVFRLGRLIDARGPGLFFLIPGIDQMIQIDLRTITYNAREIKVITRDNIRCDIESFVYYRVVDPQKAVTEVENYTAATQNLSKTVLREVLGHAELDDILASSEKLTKEIQEELDTVTDPWGVKVSAVVISDVSLPEEMLRAIAKQAEAERERRSRIIVAEGEQMAAQKMMEAAELYTKSPIALKLRELQTMAEISREKNMMVVTSTTSMRDIKDIIDSSLKLEGEENNS